MNDWLHIVMFVYNEIKDFRKEQCLKLQFQLANEEDLQL